MSDIQQGENWWKGVDGRWYPPMAAASSPDDRNVDQPDAAPLSSAHPPGSEELDVDFKNRSRRRLMLRGVGMATILVAAATVVFATRDDETFTIRGRYGILDIEANPSIQGGTTDCRGTGGYIDINPGTSVKVTNSDGKTIGTDVLESYDSDKALLDDLNATLDGGDPFEMKLVHQMDGVACFFHFTADVVKSDFYTIKVGTDRGEVTWSFDELKEDNFIVAISLGD
jgi:hypothetical protein